MRTLFGIDRTSRTKPPATRTLFKNADKAIIGTGQVIDKPSLLVENKKIVGIGRNVEAEGADVVDCTGKILMPGMIDAHVHVAMFVGEIDWAHLEHMNDEYLALRAATCLNWWVQRGFTTIFEPFARNDLVYELRRAARNGIINSPRFLISGGGVTGSYSMGKAIGPVEVTGPVEARLKVRELMSKHRYNIDVLKLRTTSEMMAGDLETKLVLTLEEATAAIDEAHKGGIAAHSHSYAGPGVNLALEAGVDAILHGHPLGWESGPNLDFNDWQLNRVLDGGKFEGRDFMKNYEIMAKKGVYWIPTFAFYWKLYNEHWEECQEIWDAFQCGRLENANKTFRKNFELAHEAGVPMALGTDSGMPFVWHGDAVWELELYKDYGYNDEQCLEAATLNAAKALWIDDRTGSLEVGKRADLLVINKNPLDNISYLRDPATIEQVYVDGELRAESGKALPVTEDAILAPYRFSVYGGNR